MSEKNPSDLVVARILTDATTWWADESCWSGGTAGIMLVRLRLSLCDTDESSGSRASSYIVSFDPAKPTFVLRRKRLTGLGLVFPRILTDARASRHESLGRGTAIISRLECSRRRV
jgi:hypothetical protein